MRERKPTYTFKKHIHYFELCENNKFPKLILHKTFFKDFSRPGNNHFKIP